VLDAAEQLRGASSTPDGAFSAMYGQLLAVASYTATTATPPGCCSPTPSSLRVLPGVSSRFDSTEIAVYRISVARKLGDYGAAVDYARKVDPRSIIDAERRGRCWEDTALALQGRGRPDAAFDALLAAEGDVPEEVCYRPWAQQLTRDLLSASTSHGLSGVREFAARLGVTSHRVRRPLAFHRHCGHAHVREVGPRRGVGISTGPSPRPASRTGRAR